MALDLTTAADVLKTLYVGPAREVFNSSTILLNWLKGNGRHARKGEKPEKIQFEGSKAYIPIHYGRNVGIGARAENSVLPTPGNQQYTHQEYIPKYVYVGIRLTGQVLGAMKSNKGAFIRALDSEMKGAARDGRSELNRIFWHDGSSVLTGIPSANSTTTIVCNSTKFLETGMRVKLMVAADGTDKGTRTITGFDPTYPDTKFVVDTAPSSATAAGDCVIREGNRNVAGATYGVALEPWGLEALCAAADPTNAGITDYVGAKTRTGNRWHQATVMANGAVLRPLTTKLMQQAWNKSDIERDLLPGLILTDHALLTEYGCLLTPDKRYPSGGQITLDGGYRGLDFNGTAVVADKDASLTNNPQYLRRMYFLSGSSLWYIINQDWDWIDDDGAILHRVQGSAGTYTGQVHAFEAYMCAFVQLGIEGARSCTVLTDLQDS